LSVPAGLFGIGWVIFGSLGTPTVTAGLVAALGAVLTVLTTGMIYASLKPIPEWHSPFTVPGYLIYSLMSGAVLLNALLLLFGHAERAVAIAAPVVIAIGWAWKSAAWRRNDTMRPVATANSATGLGEGTVRSVEWPHTERNYVLKEMGYAIARKHATRLRGIVHLGAFAFPLLATLVALSLGSGAGAVIAAIAAVVVQAAALLVERWLFFAEATHVVTLYYGR
jgi:DMSO reductase anchor subunit